MAAKKAAPKAGKALMKWDEELAKYAEQTSSKEVVPVGNMISVRGGILQIGGQPLKGNVAKVVILDNIFRNTYYGDKFDPDNPQPPVCFALNRDQEDMKPHEQVEEKQNETCEGCEMNVFGSADTGKGKACKNSRRVAVITGNDLTPESVVDQELFFLNIPVTSVKGWAFYVKGLNAHYKRPPWGVITEIATVPDAKTQFRVTFEFSELIEDGAVLQALKDRVDEMHNTEVIMFPFAKSTGDKPAVAPKGGAKFAQRGGAAKKQTAKGRR